MMLIGGLSWVAVALGGTTWWAMTEAKRAKEQTIIAREQSERAETERRQGSG